MKRLLPSGYPSKSKYLEKEFEKLLKNASVQENINSVAITYADFLSFMKQNSKERKKVEINIECEACDGSGLYSGCCEAKGKAVPCSCCDGTGCQTISYPPFVKRRRRRLDRDGHKILFVLTKKKTRQVKVADWYKQTAAAQQV